MEVYVDTPDQHVFIGWSDEPLPAALVAQAKRITELEAELARVRSA